MKSLYILLWVMLPAIILSQNYSWQLIRSGSGRGNPAVIDKNDHNIIYYGSTNQIYKSTDRGETFTQIGATIPNSSNIKNIILHPTRPGVFFVATYGGTSSNYSIVKSEDSGNTWTTKLQNLSFSFYGIPTTQDPSHPDHIYMMNGINFMRSTDFGENWDTLSTSTGSSAAPCDIEVFPDTSIILVGDNTHGIFRSTNYGLTWTQVYSTAGEIPTIAIDPLTPGVAWATKFSGGNVPVKSTDYGATWSVVTALNGTSSTWGVSVSPYDSKVVAIGTWSGSTVWITKNGGQTWLQTTLSPSNYAVHVLDTTTYFACQSGGFYKLRSPFFIPVELSYFTAETNGNMIQLKWKTITETNNAKFEIEVTRDKENYESLGTIAGYGTTTDPKFYSFDYSPASNGKYFFRIKQFDHDGSFQVYDDIEIDFSAVYNFSLEQNYPNPFNPQTKIVFTLAEASLVNLSVYNLTGEKIATVVDEALTDGIHEHIFDANGIASGSYFYRLTAKSNSGKEFISTRKFIIIR